MGWCKKKDNLATVTAYKLDNLKPKLDISHVFGHPHMFGCPLVCLDDVWMPVVHIQHKESTLCQTEGVSICIPYIWMSHPYVWMSLIPLDAPIHLAASKHIGGQPNIWRASKHTGAIKTYGGIQTYRGCIQTYGGLTTYRGHLNIRGASKHMGASKCMGHMDTSLV